MKNFIRIVFLMLSVVATAQTTSIPDAQFEQKLIDLGIDSDGTVNGQLLTSDASTVTSLNLNYVGSSTGQLIEDLTGIEDFINLEYFTVNGTMVEQLDISTLVNLKYLDCVDNMLTSLDVSNNVLLEYLDITSGGDVEPFNNFLEIDVSNNPNLHTLKASGVSKINLNNNNNNENMLIDISCWWCVGYPSTHIEDNVCIEVDDVQMAQNNQYPYSDWTVNHQYMSYNFTDDIEACTLNITSFTENIISIYPNPAKDNFYIEGNLAIEKIQVFNLSGQLMKTFLPSSTYCS